MFGKWTNSKPWPHTGALGFTLKSFWGAELIYSCGTKGLFVSSIKCNSVIWSNNFDYLECITLHWVWTERGKIPFTAQLYTVHVAFWLNWWKTWLNVCMIPNWIILFYPGRLLYPSWGFPTKAMGQISLMWWHEWNSILGKCYRRWQQCYWVQPTRSHVYFPFIYMNTFETYT